MNVSHATAELNAGVGFARVGGKSARRRWPGGHLEQHVYLRVVRRLARFLGRSPDTASAEDLRRFQLHLVDSSISAISISATITGLKFFFEATVMRPELGTKMRPLRIEHKLPVLLSREEVARLIASAGNLKYRTVLSVAHGAGLGHKAYRSYC